MFSRERLLQTVDTINMIYLGMLPAVATFSSLAMYGLRYPMVLFIGGIAVVSVYLAVAASYSSAPTNLLVGLVLLLDGPLFAVLAQLSGGNFTAIAINGFLVDGLAIWLAIMLLAVSTDRPTPDQRRATLGFGLVAIATLLWVFYPYIADQVWGDWLAMLWLIIGAVEALLARYFLLHRDHVLRSNDISARYIVVFLLLWLVAMIAGGVLFETAG